MSINGELLKDTRSSFLDTVASKIRRNDINALNQRIMQNVLTSADCNHFVRYMDKAMSKFTISCLGERDGGCDTACMIPFSSIKDASDREIGSLMCFIMGSRTPYDASNGMVLSREPPGFTSAVPSPLVPRPRCCCCPGASPLLCLSGSEVDRRRPWPASFDEDRYHRRPTDIIPYPQQ
jgi:hypothetical protein